MVAPFLLGADPTPSRSYRTLSIQVEETQLEKPKAGEKSNDPASAIRNIDVHALSPEDVFARYATSPVVGLEAAAVERRAKSGGKNVISPPKTQYWKKALNYVFGGFNFLMWIAFIVTIVSFRVDAQYSSHIESPFLAVVQAAR